jgi:hypothetical protein
VLQIDSPVCFAPLCRYIKGTVNVAGVAALLFVAAFEQAVRGAFEGSAELQSFEILTAAFDFDWAVEPCTFGKEGWYLACHFPETLCPQIVFRLYVCFCFDYTYVACCTARANSPNTSRITIALSSRWTMQVRK